jgi:hypothetical protein
MMVVMALATTFMTTPILEWIRPTRTLQREEIVSVQEYAYSER